MILFPILFVCLHMNVHAFFFLDLGDFPKDGEPALEQLALSIDVHTLLKPANDQLKGNHPIIQ